MKAGSPKIKVKKKYLKIMITEKQARKLTSQIINELKFSESLNHMHRKD